MDRQMAPTSQGLDQGGILSRDWFSDRLDRTGKDVNLNVHTVCSRRHHLRKLFFSVWVYLITSYLFKALHISMVTRTDRAIVMG